MARAALGCWGEQAVGKEWEGAAVAAVAAWLPGPARYHRVSFPLHVLRARAPTRSRGETRAQSKGVRAPRRAGTQRSRPRPGPGPPNAPPTWGSDGTSQPIKKEVLHEGRANFLLRLSQILAVLLPRNRGRAGSVLQFFASPLERGKLGSRELWRAGSVGIRGEAGRLERRGKLKEGGGVDTCLTSEVMFVLPFHLFQDEDWSSP
ncbi:uncharacterized protein LOC122748311 [Dromiciops gliroides]|uniref:uncharacterized protein LOC122748311 n=1 Tax=Dromiciops gliroides TaxID=33562 RepID=UPI001CC409E0|nr:uncharacterized protein LOC122748311 [Dromiciops gliroides]